MQIDSISRFRKIPTSLCVPIKLHVTKFVPGIVTPNTLFIPLNYLEIHITDPLFDLRN